MIAIAVAEAKENLANLLASVCSGEEVVIRKRGKNIARIVPFAQKPGRRRLGTARGKVIVKGDIHAPLPASVLKEFFR